jgi:hypothetical protein
MHTTTSHCDHRASRIIRFVVLFFIFQVSVFAVRANGYAYTDSIFKNLRKEHPRLIATANDFNDFKERLAKDPSLKERFDELAKKGDALIGAPVNKYIIPDGLRLLATSRSVLDRIYTLAFLYRITGDKKYADRAWLELDAASKFPDWNPKHFLDVGEMTHAFAIAYDWLYDYWNTDQRQQIRHAIIEHGLNRALLAYQGLALPNMSWWIDVGHNWNQVCNGGIGIGALAIADEEPKLSEAILRYVLQHLPTAMKHYGPDGAWDEGPGYWAYASKYTVAIVSALETAVGSDFGLSSIEGFAETARFPVYLTGPIDKSFNYADGGDERIGGSSLAWLAKKYNHPWIAIYQRKLEGNTPLDLLWNSFPIPTTNVKEPSPDIYFRNAEVVTMRSAWSDSTAWFLAFKGGDNKANHSHLDLGSFVLDAFGERWILDLGAENYNLPAYFSTGRNGTRWTYYRTRAEGHNTLVFNPSTGPDQDPVAEARVTKFSSLPSGAFAIADLTAAYQPANMHSVKRGIALDERKRVIVHDEMEASGNADVNWYAHTRAAITLTDKGKTALLSMNGKKLVAKILSPADAVFEVMDAVPSATSPHPEGINPNKGISKLHIHMQAVSKTNIIVSFTSPDDSKTYKGKYLQPLEKW